MSAREEPFFVGYLPPPKGLRGFTLLVSIVIFALFFAAGFLMGGTQDAPEDTGIRFNLGRQEVTGVVELTPYPILRVTDGNELLPAGRTLMMTAAGKSGVDMRAMGLEGRLAQISGIPLQRGTIDMIQLRGGRNGIAEIEGEAPSLPVEQLGRWRLAGEICDGKCLYGAMRPGRGLAHKACANLCIIGDVPPVFVSTQPVEGAEFLLITGPDGTRMPPEAYDFVAQYVHVEGEIERRGDLLILRMDPTTLAVVEE
ncbi:MAG: hypothetical protein AAF919_09355 [Pseudomonadota bacterium]